MIPIQSMQQMRTAEQIGALIQRLKPKRKRSSDGELEARTGRPAKKTGGVYMQEWRIGREQGGYFLGYTYNELRELTGKYKPNFLFVGGIDTREQFTQWLKENGYGAYKPVGAMTRTELSKQLGYTSDGLRKRLARMGMIEATLIDAQPAFSKEQVDVILSKVSAKHVQ